MLRRIAGLRHKIGAGMALILMLCLVAGMALSWPAGAQEKEKPRRNLLQLLFGRSDDDIPVKERAGKSKTGKVKAKQRKTRKSSASQVVRVQEPDALPKLETARAILVIGDFMASGLSEGLVSAYSQNPNFKVIDRSNGSSGFVRNDFHDWPTEVKALIEAEKPVAVVVMLGTNDRQQMKVGTVREAPLTDNWTKEYQLRTDALAAAMKERGVPFVWVGLPAFKSTKVNSSLLAFNDIYRKSTESAGGAFVDIWDGFVDENGAFVMNGPDMNGQPVRLRGSDGISLSKPGKRKVAFYVEKPLNKLIGGETVPGSGLSGTEIVGPVAPANIHVDRTPPMAIDDPELDGGQILLGLTGTAKAQTGAISEKLSVEGIAPPPSPGRADDFGGAVTPATATNETPEPAAVATGAPVGPGATGIDSSATNATRRQ